MGSLNPLFSIYGDYHVMDSKGIHNCNVLMVLLWWLHVVKYIGERSTPFCCQVTLAIRLAFGLCHATHHTSPFLPLYKGCWAALLSLNTYSLSLGHPLPTYIILLKGKHSKCCDMLLVSSHLSHLPPLGGVNHLMIWIKISLCID